jgi:hypothetical protein
VGEIGLVWGIAESGARQGGSRKPERGKARKRGEVGGNEQEAAEVAERRGKVLRPMAAIAGEQENENDYEQEED